MSTTSDHRQSLSKSDYLLGALIFVVTLLIFDISPVRVMTDSNYSMLLSENLLKYHTFEMDHYKLVRQKQLADGQMVDVFDYQLEEINGHIFYFLPPGTSVLSVPFIALMNRLRSS